MKTHWFPRWMWGAPEEERPLSLPVTPVFSRADVPQAGGGHGADFIGGADAYWCQACWGVVKVRHARQHERCPNCGKAVVFIAGAMGQTTTNREG